MNILTMLALIAFICFCSAFIVIQIKNAISRFVVAILVPLISSNLLYWSACLGETMCDEYFTWATLFLVPMFFSGTVAIFIGLYVFKRKTKVDNGS